MQFNISNIDCGGFDYKIGVKVIETHRKDVIKFGREHEFILSCDLIVFPVADYYRLILSVFLRGLVLVKLVIFGLRLEEDSSTVTFVVEDGTDVNIAIVIKENCLCMRKMGVVDELSDEYAIAAPFHPKSILIVLRKEPFIEIEMRSTFFFSV